MTDTTNAAVSPRRRGHHSIDAQKEAAPAAPIRRKPKLAANHSSAPAAILPPAPIDLPHERGEPAIVRSTPKDVMPARKSSPRKGRSAAMSATQPSDNLPPTLPSVLAGGGRGHPRTDDHCWPASPDLTTGTAGASDHRYPDTLSASVAGETSTGYTSGVTHDRPAGSDDGAVNLALAPINTPPPRRRKNMPPIATGAELTALIAAIRDTHRQRRALMGAAGDMTRRIKSQERWAATARTKAMGIAVDPLKFPKVEPVDERVIFDLYPSFYAARAAIVEQQKQVEKTLAKMVRQLPVYDWCMAVRGISEGSIAVLIGEAGDIGRFSGPAKLWKRFGVGMHDGQPQRRTTDKALAVAFGYNAERRAQLWMIGENITLKSADPYYRALYDARKVLERAKPGVQTDMHAHRRAMRYAQKRFLRKLWSAWRTAISASTPISGLPLAEHQEDGA